MCPPSKKRSNGWVGKGTGCEDVTLQLRLFGFGVLVFIRGRLKELQVFSLEKKRLEGNINQIYNIFKQVDKEKKCSQMFSLMNAYFS